MSYNFIFWAMLIYFDSFIVGLIGPCKILFTNFFQGWREVSSQNDLVMCYVTIDVTSSDLEKSSSILLYATLSTWHQIKFWSDKGLNSNLQLMLTRGYETMLKCSKPMLYLQVPVSHHCVYRHIYFKIDGTNRYLQRHSLFSSRGEEEGTQVLQRQRNSISGP